MKKQDLFGEQGLKLWVLGEDAGSKTLSFLFSACLERRKQNLIGGNTMMKSQGRRSLSQAGLKALTDLGDYGLNMVTWSGYTVVVSGCWKTTILNK